MAGSGKQIDAEFFDLDRKEAGALGGVKKKQNPLAPAPGTDFRHRLQGTGHVGTMGENDEPGFRLPAGMKDSSGIDAPLAVGGHLDHLHALLLQSAQRPGDRIMLHAGGHHPVAGRNRPKSP